MILYSFWRVTAVLFDKGVGGRGRGFVRAFMLEQENFSGPAIAWTGQQVMEEASKARHARSMI
jgi:hypothetical protein